MVPVIIVSLLVLIATATTLLPYALRKYNVLLPAFESILPAQHSAYKGWRSPLPYILLIIVGALGWVYPQLDESSTWFVELYFGFLATTQVVIISYALNALLYMHFFWQSAAQLNEIILNYRAQIRFEAQAQLRTLLAVVGSIMLYQPSWYIAGALVSLLISLLTIHFKARQRLSN